MFPLFSIFSVLPEEDKLPSLCAVSASKRLIRRDMCLLQRAACGADAARSWARKSPSGVWKPIRALVRLYHPVSLCKAAGALVHYSPSTLTSSFCLWQEDGTVHRPSCTRTEGVTDRLAAGLLNSSCRITPGFWFYFCVWFWSVSAGNTKVGKSGGLRRRRLTSQASACVNLYF